MFNLDNITKKDNNKDWPHIMKTMAKKEKVLIVFDDMISHVMANKKAQQVLNDLFIRCRKLNISLHFLTQSYFSVQKDVRLNCTH